jgi:hypothetical protein
MQARKFHLDRPLSLRENREFERLISAHPAFDHLTHSHNFKSIIVKLTDSNAWVASGSNMFELIEKFLKDSGIDFEPSLVSMRQAA